MSWYIHDKLKMAMGTRYLGGNYSIRVRVWSQFYTRGSVNGRKRGPNG